MESSSRFTLVLVAISTLVSWCPADAWYKQATGPSYYSVGRASGLLSGIRRSPYVRRSELEPGPGLGVDESDPAPESPSQPKAVLKNIAACVKDISPNLESCVPAQGGSSAFQCKAEVLLSLDPQSCTSA